jgi:lipoate-protein ligase A
MQHLQLTLDTAAANLALDEALLDAAEAGESEGCVLRLWESPHYCAVLGRSSAPEIEVNLAACRQAGIPVLRRSSGGGTILAGPGCLMYAVVLDFHTYPQLQAIDLAHQFVLEHLAHMLAPPSVHVAGISDLALGGAGGDAPLQKFSGNALRIKRRHLLYHGTLLYDFDLTNLSRWLAKPTRTPDYRNQRPHAQFVTNIDCDRPTLTHRLLTGWDAHTPLSDWPAQRTAELCQQKYAHDPKWVIHTSP